MLVLTGMFNPSEDHLHAQTQDFLPAALTETTVEEHLSESLPLETPFIDTNGHRVVIGDYFSNSDLPVIMSLNYSNCPMLCVLQLNGLLECLKQMDLIAGQDYRIVSISLDPNESPEQARLTKQKYLKLYGKAASADGWEFLVGEKSSIDQMADALGIGYIYVDSRKEYSHPAVFAICTPEGVISRYHYGIEFPEKTVRLSLVEASQGKIGTTLDQILLFCFHYDANEGRYAPAARRIMKVGGLVTVFALGAFIWHFKKKEPEENQVIAGSQNSPASSEVDFTKSMAQS